MALSAPCAVSKAAVPISVILAAGIAIDFISGVSMTLPNSSKTLLVIVLSASNAACVFLKTLLTS